MQILVSIVTLGIAVTIQRIVQSNKTIVEAKNEAKEPPAELVCSISHEVMEDPVVAEDGHTYERREIERWFESHKNSPRTRQPMSQRLVPNLSLRSQIDEYRKSPSPFLISVTGIARGLGPLPPRPQPQQPQPQQPQQPQPAEERPHPMMPQRQHTTLQLGHEAARRVTDALQVIITTAPDRAAAVGAPTTNVPAVTQFAYETVPSSVNLFSYVYRFSSFQNMANLADAAFDVPALQHHATMLARLADQQRAASALRPRPIPEREMRLRVALRDDDVDAVADLASENFVLKPPTQGEETDDLVLHYAAAGSGEVLTWILDNYTIDVERKSVLDGATPLAIAAMFDSKRSVAALLKKGADPNTRCSGVPSHLAGFRGLQHGRQLIHHRPLCMADARPLHVVGAARVDHPRRDVIELLLRHNADVTARDDSGATPLHCSASACDVTAITTLLRTAKDGRDFTNDRATALHRLCETKAPCARVFRDDPSLPLTAIRAFVESDPELLNATNAQGLTALHLASANANPHNVNTGASLAAALIDLGADMTVKASLPPSPTPLHTAAGNGKIAVVRVLLAKGAIETCDDLGRTATHLAVLKKAPAACVSLLASKAPVNSVDKSGHGPLHAAAALDSVPAAQALLDAGWSADCRGPATLETPLFVAAENNSLRVAELLVQHNADVNAAKRDGTTPLHKASSRGLVAMARFLLHSGARCQASLSGATPLDKAILVQDSRMQDLLRSSSPRA